LLGSGLTVAHGDKVAAADRHVRECLQAVHNAVRDSLGAPDASIRVLITEVDPELWSSGGQTLAERGR
jgi:4-oxalocrotonate tautomerase